MPRHPKAKPQHLLFSLLIAVIVLAASLARTIEHSFKQAGGVPFPAASASAAAPLSSDGHQSPAVSRVVRAVDGDTLKLDNGERVRLIGVDTPELHENSKLYRDAARTGQDAKIILQMGQVAYDFTRKLVEGKEVRLEFDVQARDKHGRLLAYVYLNDGTFLNEEIIKNGYAYPMAIPPNVKHASDFRALFEQARAKGLGLWK
jgi:micrococcal nuclease